VLASGLVERIGEDGARLVHRPTDALLRHMFDERLRRRRHAYTTAWTRLTWPSGRG